MGKLLERIRAFIPNRKVKAVNVFSGNPRIKIIRTISGHLGLIVFICLLMVTQFFRYFILRTGHCNIDGCLSPEFIAQNITDDGECSFCQIVWLDEFLIDPEDGLGFRLHRLQLTSIQLYTNIISYLFLSFGAYFYNPYFLLIHLITQSFLILVFTIKLFFKLLSSRGEISSIFELFIFCPSKVCTIIWMTIYSAAIILIVFSITLTITLNQLISLNAIKKKLKKVITRVDENWVTSLNEDIDKEI